jgi:hypothetical protein
MKAELVENMRVLYDIRMDLYSPMKKSYETSIQDGSQNFALNIRKRLKLLPVAPSAISRTK